MSPWTAVFESLHSALIDELTERRPEPKPGLGMPTRKNAFVIPSSGLTMLACGIDVDQSRGIAFLGCDADAAKVLKTSPEKLWVAIVKRAGAEFMRRNIRPVIGNYEAVTGTLPKGSPEPQRVIWVPITLDPGLVYYGLGV